MISTCIIFPFPQAGSTFSEISIGHAFLCLPMFLRVPVSSATDDFHSSGFFGFI